MRESRRDIQNIAWLKLFVDNAFKRIYLKQIGVWTVLFHRHFLTHTPATTARTLNDKHVILIQMGPNAATGYREGDHQVVHAPVGQGAERMHQGCGRLMPMVDGLNQ
ncbi:hypothetical protein D3C87_1417200 [compost metagenome]